MSFLKHLIVASQTVDLADFVPDVLRSVMIEDDPGTEGSWEEPAWAPSRVYKITKLRLPNLDEYPELRDELRKLKAGDQIRCNFSYKEDDGNEYEVEGLGAVYNLKWPDIKTLTFETKLFGVWEGEKPPQSQKGRHRLAFG